MEKAMPDALSPASGTLPSRATEQQSGFNLAPLVDPPQLGPPPCGWMPPVQERPRFDSSGQDRLCPTDHLPTPAQTPMMIANPNHLMQQQQMQAIPRQNAASLGIQNGPQVSPQTTDYAQARARMIQQNQQQQGGMQMDGTVPLPLVSPNSSPPGGPDHDGSYKPKVRPSQGDAVLIDFMGGFQHTDTGRKADKPLASWVEENSTMGGTHVEVNIEKDNVENMEKDVREEAVEEEPVEKKRVEKDDLSSIAAKALNTLKGNSNNNPHLAQFAAQVAAIEQQETHQTSIPRKPTFDSSRQDRPHPTYPIPIPPEKYDKALALYNRYRLEEGLSQKVFDPLPADQLGHATSSSSRSVTDSSLASELTSELPTISISTTRRTSNPEVTTTPSHEGATDTSSVVSFAESAINPNNFITYDGKKVKQRTRVKLNPVKKASAALIRHLGSCWVCRARRVPCPLTHHDIESLERARQSKLQKKIPQAEEEPFLAIGVQQGAYFYCQNFDGFCHEAFADQEALKSHFEIAHFRFTRIDSAHRFICRECQSIYDVLASACPQCGSLDSIQHWIYGKLNLKQGHQNYGNDSRGLFSDDSYSAIPPHLEARHDDSHAPIPAPATDSGYESLGITQDLRLTGRLLDTDTESIMTDNRDLYLPQEAKHKLAASFSKELCQNLESLFHQNATTRLQHETVLDALKAFAMRIGYVARPGQEEKAALFVRQQRNRIAEFFRLYIESMCIGIEDEAKTVSQVQDGFTVEEKMNLWDLNPAEDVYHDPDDSDNVSIGPLEDEEEDYGIANFPEARKFLIESDAYRWLISRLQSDLVLTSCKGTVIESIRCQILTILNAQHAADNYQSTYRAEFLLQWSPEDFLKTQFPDNQCQSLGQVIVLCGSEINAQSLSCAEYMHQVWPKTGLELLRALEDCRAKKHFVSHQVELSDGTKLTFTFKDQSVHVSGIGSRSSLTELGEQLAWMCAALGSAPSKDDIMYSIPRISRNPTSDYAFEVYADYEHLDSHQKGSNYLNGTCWQKLFRNPVIVKGYPILERYNNERGLELPFNMMAFLGNATRAAVFDETLLLKGYSTMLVPTARVEKSLSWHFLFNEDQSRISYQEARQQCPSRTTVDVVNASLLENKRHFLGWASEVEQQTGTKNCKYEEIDWPTGDGCEFAGSGIALDKMSLSVGKIASVGASAARGIKDTPGYLIGAMTYSQEIRDARNIQVVLYDLGDQRGWLVDGASALLHLACTRLSRHPSSFFDPEEFKFAVPGQRSSAAMAALLDPANRMLVLDEDIELSGVITITTEEDPVTGATSTSRKREEKHTIKRTLFQDIVQEFYYKLECLHERENTCLASSSYQLRGTDRERLEGFAYMDLVDGPKVILPRELYLKPSGAGWVAFTKSIRAVTLLARGFGDIIRPTEDSDKVCQYWKSAPKGRDYLAATTGTLKEICQRQGDARARPLKLAKNVFWHRASMLFEQCECQPGRKNAATPCVRVQELYPPSMGSKTYPDPFVNATGGVLFGRTEKVSLPWIHERSPAVESTDALSSSSARDSALGTSISSRSDTDDGAGAGDGSKTSLKRPLERVTDLLAWPHKRHNASYTR